MTGLAIGIAALLVVAVAAAWPYLPSLPAVSAGLSSSERAAWVNRLFSLTESSDDPAVTAAAKALIAALVASGEPKKGK